MLSKVAEKTHATQAMSTSAAYTALQDQLRDKELLRCTSLIGGEWHDAATTQYQVRDSNTPNLPERQHGKLWELRVLVARVICTTFAPVKSLYSVSAGSGVSTCRA